jgi:hypothetical protein
VEYAVDPRLATRLQKGRAFGSQGIAGEKQHTLAQIGMLMAQHGVEISPIESWHAQITQHHVIAMLWQLPQGKVPIGRRVHYAAIMAEPCACARCGLHVSLRESQRLRGLSF